MTAGEILSLALLRGGPFATYEALYRQILQCALDEADSSLVLGVGNTVESDSALSIVSQTASATS